ncbi:MAG: hypothetical protein ACRDJ4_13020 [Actinomycetota bacterium]
MGSPARTRRLAGEHEEILFLGPRAQLCEQTALADARLPNHLQDLLG